MHIGDMGSHQHTVNVYAKSNAHDCVLGMLPSMCRGSGCLRVLKMKWQWMISLEVEEQVVMTSLAS